MCCYESIPEYSWGDGDSLDREHVRDIILNGLKFVEDRLINVHNLKEKTNAN